eukprot:CAMPEP_0201284400 /NCGR_PEP_ID=MMETSP1317-20130820/72798_1 /ASSEMBLY_ACC=CAM_ASM_000770 /TAXON_ID=187299 /ORGANISM="Undescribed Undescribed, Strain Undescribed" /LENGTH=92 /DNA_ID=CAMNT_0047604409 /DNA_START=632 /DNA_END=910 /DNA_ORIENTATION=+
MIVASIISGIIIDTFGELRAKQEAIENDSMNTCLICSIEREAFDRLEGVDFDEHVKGEHLSDEYCWIKIHLREKPKDELNGIESYIKDQIDI